MDTKQQTANVMDTNQNEVKKKRRVRNPRLENIEFKTSGLRIPVELWNKMHLICERENITMTENLYYALKLWVAKYEKKYGPLTSQREFNFAEEIINSI